MIGWWGFLFVGKNSNCMKLFMQTESSNFLSICSSGGTITPFHDTNIIYLDLIFYFIIQTHLTYLTRRILNRKFDLFEYHRRYHLKLLF